MAPIPKSRLERPMKSICQMWSGLRWTFYDKTRQRKIENKTVPMSLHLCSYSCCSVGNGVESGNRFISIRIYSNDQSAKNSLAVTSDNGTNFVGAKHELKEILKAMDQKTITRKMSNHRINPI